MEDIASNEANYPPERKKQKRLARLKKKNRNNKKPPRMFLFVCQLELSYVSTSFYSYLFLFRWACTDLFGILPAPLK